MSFEVEIKARLKEPERTEARAAELGTFKKETFKEDIYFRPKGESSPVPQDRYRLRREDGQAVVTFKRKVPVSGAEVNKETEFTVDDAHAFFQFADRYGFEPFVVKRKQSRVYRIGRADVELNQVEHLGHFAEIEIMCEARDQVPVARIELARLLNRLGLTSEDVETGYYIYLIQQAHPVRYRFIDDPELDWPFEEVQIEGPVHHS